MNVERIFIFHDDIERLRKVTLPTSIESTEGYTGPLIEISAGEGSMVPLPNLQFTLNYPVQTFEDVDVVLNNGGVNTTLKPGDIIVQFSDGENKVFPGSEIERYTALLCK